jgi:hypothetical protein
VAARYAFHIVRQFCLQASNQASIESAGT